MFIKIFSKISTEICLKKKNVCLMITNCFKNLSGYITCLTEWRKKRNFCKNSCEDKNFCLIITSFCKEFSDVCGEKFPSFRRKKSIKICCMINFKKQIYQLILCKDKIFCLIITSFCQEFSDVSGEKFPSFRRKKSIKICCMIRNFKKQTYQVMLCIKVEICLNICDCLAKKKMFSKLCLKIKTVI